MFKPDRIFYWASALSVVGLVLAAFGYESGFLLFVLAYLLRPMLRELGLASKFADERQQEIHSRSGNIAFIALIMIIAGMVLWRLSDGQSAGDLYTLLGLGLVARAITGLVMSGEYRKAGVVIITALGLYLGIFIVLDAGFSTVSLVGVVVALIIAGVGQIGRKFPRTIGTVILVFAVLFVMAFEMFAFSRNSLSGWFLMVIPMMTSALCFLLGSSRSEEGVSSRTRSIAFGALGTGTAVVFILTLIVGSTEQSKSGGTVVIPAAKEVEVQGVAATNQIQYYKNGNVEFCFLARVDTLSGQTLPAGTGVHFTEEGVFDWCFLPRNTEIQGYLCNGSGHGFMTVFHPNGRLKTAYLVEDQVIQGIPCARFRFLSAFFGGFFGKAGRTTFYPDGRLRSCELSRNFTIDGHDFRRGDLVRFDENGKLVSDL